MAATCSMQNFYSPGKEKMQIIMSPGWAWKLNPASIVARSIENKRHCKHGWILSDFDRCICMFRRLESNHSAIAFVDLGTALSLRNHIFIVDFYPSVACGQTERRWCCSCPKGTVTIFSVRRVLRQDEIGLDKNKWSNLMLMWAHLPFLKGAIMYWHCNLPSHRIASLDPILSMLLDVILLEIWIIVQYFMSSHRQTDRQKVMHMSHRAVCTGGLFRGDFWVYFSSDITKRRSFFLTKSVIILSKIGKTCWNYFYFPDMSQ